ncbi:MAG TPA: hypothetical protein VLE44_01770, partial [Candidatus Saccharimonadales bacterium]|nr:hypothetical protein [Candidatus Saccharimonadales bacterium]
MDNISPSGVVNSFKTSSNKMPYLVGTGIVIVLLGVGVGWMVSGRKTTGSAPKTASVTVTNNEAGAKDASSFKDTATGTLKEGGIKGEGMFHLERPGGITQNVYLTSTIIDMSPFVGKKVQVWGETQAGQHAGWFMDVGKIKV